VKINGQEVGAIAASADMEKVLEAINNNVDNVEATAFNTVVAKNKGNGVTTDGQFDIAVKELGQSNATTFQISASSSMEELVANINAEAGSVVAASINDEGKLVLSNQTGATITVTDASASGAATADGGSGIGGTTAASFAGFVKLTSLDGTAVRLEQGNIALSSAGTTGGVQAGFNDLEVLGFRETKGQVTLDDVRLDDDYTVYGKTVTTAGAIEAWDKGDLKINGVEIYDADVVTTTMAKKVESINNFSQDTGVTAQLSHRLVFDMSSAYTTNLATDLVVINGSEAAVGADIDKLISNINVDTKDTGVTAVKEGQNMVLHATGLTQINIVEKAAGSATTQENKLLDGIYQAQIRLDSSANQPISIELGASANVAAHGFLEANVGAADYDVNAPTMSAGGGASMAGLAVTSASSATAAITTLDNAINRVNEIRGDLGAIQNRLEYTVNNLSSISNSTAASRGRILDADFAAETSALTKHQILTQAATSMLAQANQSKQGILALLQG
jgi:flagellin